MERSINDLKVLHHFSYYPAMEGIPLSAPISGPTVQQEDGQVRKQQKIGQSFKGYSYHPRPVEWEAKDIFATQEIFKIESDIDALSCYFKSHVYSALGAVLHLEQSFIIWADFPIKRFECHVDVEKKVTDRIYYAGPLKSRQYHYLELTAREKLPANQYRPTYTYNLGLTKALQMRKLGVESGLWEEMETFGMRTTIYNWDNFEAEILCLVLDKDLVRKESVRNKLADWLDMDPRERPIQTIA